MYTSPSTRFEWSADPGRVPGGTFNSPAGTSSWPGRILPRWGPRVERRHVKAPRRVGTTALHIATPSRLEKRTSNPTLVHRRHPMYPRRTGAAAARSGCTQDAIPRRPLHPIGSLTAPSDSKPWLRITWSHQQARRTKWSTSNRVRKSPHLPLRPRASPSTQDAIPRRPLHPIGSTTAPSDSKPWLRIAWSHQRARRTKWSTSNRVRKSPPRHAAGYLPKAKAGDARGQE